MAAPVTRHFAEFLSGLPPKTDAGTNTFILLTVKTKEGPAESATSSLIVASKTTEVLKDSAKNALVIAQSSTYYLNPLTFFGTNTFSINTSATYYLNPDSGAITFSVDSGSATTDKKSDSATSTFALVGSSVEKLKDATTNTFQIFTSASYYIPTKVFKDKQLDVLIK